MTHRRQAVIGEAGAAMQAYQRSTQAFDDAIGRALGLNATDLRGLDWLADGPKSAGELSRGTGLSTAATTTLIDRLERKGYVERVPDPDDRRRVLARMTRDGQRRLARFYRPLVNEGSRLFDGLSDEAVARMRDWLIAARELTDRHRERVERGRAGRR